MDSFKIPKTPRLRLFISLSLPLPPNSFTKLLAVPDLFNTCRALPFPECHIGESIPFCSGFWEWLPSLNNSSLNLLHFFQGSVTHFLYLPNNRVYECITVDSLTEGQLDYFQFLAIMNKVALNICVKGFMLSVHLDN